MPQCRQQGQWGLEGRGQVIDLQTAVKYGYGILGGRSGEGLLAEKDRTLVTAAEKLELKKIIDELDSAVGEDVPSVFICPISLEPMVDPVTLCTGQTYERTHILKWLSLGHLNCPTTMQELWDDDVTPNHTLRQLIHAWFSQRHLLLKKRSEDVQGRAAGLVQSLKKGKGKARVQPLKDLLKLILDQPSVEKTVADSGGVTHLSSLLGPLTSHAIGSEVIAILVNLSLETDAKTNLMQPAKISLVVDMLNEGTIDTKINCTKFIGMLMGEKSFRSELVSSPSLLVALLRLVKDERHPNGIAAGLSLLKSVCFHEHVRSLIVSIGAIPQLVERLPNLLPDCLEPALNILDNLSANAEGQMALKNYPQAIPIAVKLLMTSEACTRHGLSILWNIINLAPDVCASLAIEAGLGAKLLFVIQSGYDAELKQRAACLLKLCSLNYTPTLFMSKCKLTRTIQ